MRARAPGKRRYGRSTRKPASERGYYRKAPWCVQGRYVDDEVLLDGARRCTGARSRSRGPPSGSTWSRRKPGCQETKESDMDVRERLRQRFNRAFEHWETELPIDALEPGVVWLICHRGWTIWTRYDVENGREYLDYYATHRMTNDRHLRMYVDGDDVGLPTMDFIVGGGRHRGGDSGAPPICGEAAGGEGLRHDRRGPWPRRGERSPHGGDGVPSCSSASALICLGVSAGPVPLNVLT